MFILCNSLGFSTQEKYFSKVHFVLFSVLAVDLSFQNFSEMFIENKKNPTTLHLNVKYLIMCEIPEIFIGNTP